MIRTTVEELKRAEIYEVIKSTLEEEYTKLKVKKITFSEDCVNNTLKVDCRFSEGDLKAKTLKSTGVGLVDALFLGLLEHYGKRFPSINTISFEGFEVLPDFSRKIKSGSESPVDVAIKLSNSCNSVMTFRTTGRSFVSACALGVFRAIEFYINAEKAFKKLKILIKEAQDRNRFDISQDYVSKISTIVKVTSYEQV